ncbi:MAG: MFS transporter [Patescibacteria group bacterium]|nr:MFS transporter [Patescibacteria group bacterium]
MRANIINFLTEGAVASSLLFIPIFAKELGASNFEVGLIGTFYGLAMFLSFYIFGRLSDIYGRKKFLILGLIASIISFPLQALASSPFQLLLARASVGFCAAIFPAALVSHIYDANKKVGKFSSFGSLGWAGGQFLAALIAVYWKIFLLGSFFFFLAFLFALKMEIPKISLSVPLFPLKVIKNSFSVYLAFLLRHSGAHMIWIIFPLYLASFGISKLWIGIIYFTNSFFQFLIMPMFDKYKSSNLVILGLILSAITFYSFSLASTPFQFLPTQILLATSWSCLYVGSLKLVLEKNIEKATAAGLLKSNISLAEIFGPIFGGLLSQYFGYLACIFGAIVLTLFGFLIFYLIEFKSKAAYE